MKRLLILLLPIFLFSKEYDLNLVFALAKNAVNKKHLNILVRVVQKTFLENGLNVKVKALDEKESLKQFLSSKIDIMAMSPSIYIYNKNVFNTKYDDRWIISLNGEYFEQFYLLANINSKNPLDNISKYTISYPSGNEGARIWFESFIYKKYKRPIDSLIRKKQLMAKESKILTDIFFNKDSLGLVSKANFELLLELNPSLLKKVKIIKKSEVIFLSALAISKKDVDEKLKKKFLEIVNSARNILGNTASSSTMKLNTMINLEEKDLEKIKDIYFEHKSLKNKYN